MGSRKIREVTMKKVILAVCAVLAVVIIFGALGTTGGDQYDYKGYVIDLFENARGETVIVALWDDVESEFVLKSNTKVTAPAKESVAVGDLVMLTARKNSNFIKKMKVSTGYSTEGRLFYVEGEAHAFLLAKRPDDTNMMVKAIDFSGTEIPGVSGIGDVIKVYYSSPLSPDDPKVTVEALVFVENGTAEDFTAEDIAFIESLGYKMRTE